MKRLVIPLSIALLVLQGAHAESQPGNVNKPQVSVEAQKPTTQTGWLGVMLRPVPSALRSQLEQLIPNGQGLLVGHVIPGSPAAKAGIRQNDVLLNYGDQKLYSPTQLSTLAAADPGKNIPIQVVRQGKLTTLNVVIGTREFLPMQQTPFWRSYPPTFRQPTPAKPEQKGNQVLAWDSFESVLVNTLKDGRYHAEVSYKDPQGETKTFRFEGKKEEIIQQIRQQKDLPDEKRKALLDALDLKVEKVFGQPFNTPFYQGNPFNTPFFQDPFFQGNPFNTPFFQNNSQMPPMNPWVNKPGMPQKQSAPPSNAPAL